MIKNPIPWPNNARCAACVTFDIDSESLIHLEHPSDGYRRYGGLSTAMKVTWGTFMLGWLAILGVPPFSGFLALYRLKYWSGSRSMPSTCRSENIRWTCGCS